MTRRQKPGGAILVSFSGIDGAGKSTQIEALSSRLVHAGLHVRLIRFWDDVARLKTIRETSGHAIFRGDKGAGSPAAPINRRDKNVQSGIMTMVRLFLYMADALSLRWVAKRVTQSGADVVIFDRYLFDELANLNLQNRAIRAYARLLLALVPKPHASFLLDADPEQARARKPEYPLEFLHKNRQSYLSLAAMAEGITVVTPMPIDKIQGFVLERVLKELPDGASPGHFVTASNYGRREDSVSA